MDNKNVKHGINNEAQVFLNSHFTSHTPLQFQNILVFLFLLNNKNLANLVKSSGISSKFEIQLQKWFGPTVGRVLKGAMIREILVESSQCYAHETRPRLCTLALFLVCSISLQLLCCSLPYIDRIWLLNFWLDITIKNVKGILEFFDMVYIFLVYILPPKLGSLALGFEICMQICISNWLIDIKKDHMISQFE